MRVIPGVSAWPNYSGEYLDLPGNNGDYASMPHNASYIPAGDFRIEAKVWHTNASSTIRECYFGKEAVGGLTGLRFFKFHTTPFTRISLLTSNNGGSSYTAQWTSTAFTPGNNAWFFVRADLDADNGASQTDALLYWKQNEGDSWTSISSSAPDASVGLSMGTAPWNIGLASTDEYMDGRVGWLKLWDNMAGTGNPLIAFEPKRMNVGDLSYVDRFSKQTWTINQSGSSQEAGIL